MTNLRNQLTNVAVWLENGCEPAMAAQELRKICGSLPDEPGCPECARLRNDIQELTCGDPRKVCPNCRDKSAAEPTAPSLESIWAEYQKDRGKLDAKLSDAIANALNREAKP